MNAHAVRVPYHCPIVEGFEGPCPGLPPHDCAVLLDTHLAADADVDPDRRSDMHRTAVMLILSTQMHDRSDWPEILAVATGYPYPFVREHVKQMRRVGVFDSGAPPEWTNEGDGGLATVSFVMWALAVNGVVDVREVDGKPAFQYNERRAQHCLWDWKPPPRCQGATGSGRQCKLSGWSWCEFCDHHKNGHTLVWEPSDGAAPAENDPPPEGEAALPLSRGTVCW